MDIKKFNKIFISGYFTGVFCMLAAFTIKNLILALGTMVLLYISIRKLCEDSVNKKEGK